MANQALVILNTILWIVIFVTYSLIANTLVNGDYKKELSMFCFDEGLTVNYALYLSLFLGQSMLFLYILYNSDMVKKTKQIILGLLSIPFLLALISILMYIDAFTNKSEKIEGRLCLHKMTQEYVNYLKVGIGINLTFSIILLFISTYQVSECK